MRDESFPVWQGEQDVVGLGDPASTAGGTVQHPRWTEPLPVMVVAPGSLGFEFLRVD